MKNLKFVLVTFLFSFILPESGFSAVSDSLKYVNASDFQLIGKGFRDAKNTYQRLPDRLEGKTRPPVWSLSKNCSGLAIRFCTNSTIIAAKWEVTGDITMNHFSPAGRLTEFI